MECDCSLITPWFAHCCLNFLFSMSSFCSGVSFLCCIRVAKETRIPSPSTARFDSVCAYVRRFFYAHASIWLFPLPFIIAITLCSLPLERRIVVITCRIGTCNFSFLGLHTIIFSLDHSLLTQASSFSSPKHPFSYHSFSPFEHASR